MTTRLKLNAGRPPARVVIEVVAAVSAKTLAYTMSADGSLSAQTHLSSSDGDIAYEITVFKDGRVHIYHDPSEPGDEGQWASNT